MGLFSFFSESNVLYFPGEVTYFKFRDNFELYKKIFYKLGIDFKVFDNHISSGLKALELGYEFEARKLARSNFELFKEKNIISIITNSPEDYKMFLQNYPELLSDWYVSVKNIWEIIFEKLMNKPGLIKYKAMEVVGFHDSCYLGRYCGIYRKPREILEIIGYEIKEMSDSVDESICCGSCGGLTITNPELANKIAKNRILQAKRVGIKKLIVCSMENYELLKRNSENSGVEVLELSDVLSLALGISQPEDKEFNEEISKEEELVLEAKGEKMLANELKEEKDELWEKIYDE